MPYPTVSGMLSVVAPCLDARVQYLEHEVERRPRGVLRAELDVEGVLARPAHSASGLREHLFTRHLEHVFHVLRARRDEHVDARPGRVPQRFPASVDVGDARPRKACDDRSGRTIADRACDRLHRLEVPLTGDGEACFDVVHTEPSQLLGDLELLAGVEGDPGRLLAVAQCRVEDDQMTRVSDLMRLRRERL